MEKQGKIVRDKALDMPEYRKSGWKVQQQKAFKNVAPSIIMQLDPIPQLDRQDVRDYIEKQFKLYEETVDKESQAAASTMKEAEQKYA